MRQVTLDIDVTDAAGSGEPLHTQVTVTLPASGELDPGFPPIRRISARRT